MNSSEVTIVVCTYNRAALLRDTLASLLALQTDDKFTYEVLVVNNASTDDTAAVIEQARRDARIPLRGVFEPQPGVSFARNRGIQEARTPWIAFFDDDQVADARWLAELMAMAAEQQVRCVGGANRLRVAAGAPALSRAGRKLLSESIERDVPCRYTETWAPGTGNMLIRRDVFEELGVFDVSLREAGEDADLYRRMLAAKIVSWYTPRAISYHVIPAYRLRDDYLRWKAFRNGGHVARRNFLEQGRLLFCVLLVARVGQALLVHWPRLVWARLRQTPESIQNARCLLWRCEGYLRFALHLLAPKLFAQQSFLSSLEFRNEQQLFVHD